MIKTLTAMIVILVANNASGFTFLFGEKYKHLDSELTIYAGINQLAPDGRSFNIAFEDAALDWQSQTRVTVEVIHEYLDPCTQTTPQIGILGGLDEKNSIDMTPDICGQQGFGALAAISIQGGSSPRDQTQESSPKEIFFLIAR